MMFLHSCLPQRGTWKPERGTQATFGRLSTLATLFRVPPSDFRLPRLGDQNGHDLVRLGDEPHRLSPTLEDESQRLALVGSDAVRALHRLAATEAPGTGRPAIGGVVTSQDHRRALLGG